MRSSMVHLHLILCGASKVGGKLHLRGPVRVEQTRGRMGRESVGCRGR
jgi:hypothetical protein